ncbi:hypothetical protein KF707_08060 [Candidatus Obscuribacterales bacterium]|nr:hypothetical protein [Candidatus Obscuribacterales bacterium]MBX3136176.1 hypothetical protein [Candidatus Obscuribacterales bacterium]
MPSSATTGKQAEVKAGKRGRVEKADTYLGVASKVLTIFAALSTVSVWLYTTYYVGTLDVKPNKPFQELTLKLYDERGIESVYHTGHLKLLPGRYQILATTDDNQPSRLEATVNFNRTTVVPYVVAEAVETEAGLSSADKSSDEKSNRRWWQIWKRN